MSVSKGRSSGGTGLTIIQNTNGDVTTFGILGVGYFAEADLPDAADYPWSLVGVVETGGDNRLLFSDGTAWQTVTFASDSV